MYHLPLTRISIDPNFLSVSFIALSTVSYYNDGEDDNREERRRGIMTSKQPAARTFLTSTCTGRHCPPVALVRAFADYKIKKGISKV